MDIKETTTCSLSADKASVAELLSLTETVASRSGLAAKDAGRLRLLSEELVCMLPELLAFSTGEFRIERDGKAFALQVSLTPSEALTADVREKLLSVSKSGKNAAASGILAKIKLAAQFMLIDYDEISRTSMLSVSDGMGVQPSFNMPVWTLNTYREKAAAENADGWDELEMSIIAKLADDVIVGMQGKRVDIIIKKAF